MCHLTFFECLLAEYYDHACGREACIQILKIQNKGMLITQSQENWQFIDKIRHAPECFKVKII